MRVLKWLFHPVNIIIVVILFVIFLNRQSLFPEMSGSRDMKQLAERVDSVAEQMEHSGDAVATHTSVLAPEDKAPVLRPSAPDHKAASEESSKAGNIASMQEGASSNQMEEGTSVSLQEQLLPPSGKTRTQTGDSPGMEPRSLMADARRAAWYGDLPRAVARYKALIAMQPDNYDAYGELGNVFLAMGDNSAAASAYVSSAKLLQQAGYPQAAWQIWSMVSRLDPQKARELYRILSQGRQPGTGMYRYR